MKRLLPDMLIEQHRLVSRTYLRKLAKKNGPELVGAVLRLVVALGKASGLKA
jgi:hypothetical protein